MAWTIKFARKAEKNLDQLDKPVIQRILKISENPCRKRSRAVGKPLKGHLSELWKYRIGDYRLICSIEDDQLLVLVVHVGHCREVYKKSKSIILQHYRRPYHFNRSDQQRSRHCYLDGAG